MVDIFEDQQTLLDDIVALLAFDMSNKAHAASVVLVGWVVQTLPIRYCRFHHTHSFKVLGPPASGPMMKKAERHI
ncbi:hypothetical protein [uncultured Dechloromonas sp.]|uniref:hypothetical protein n=1 Tax=uncultured Dechloromonas sp. TaxID=171719 RepID=UPI002600CC78|nr:hypothetical protein [uncultured Dechloromonas sp.]